MSPAVNVRHHLFACVSLLAIIILMCSSASAQSFGAVTGTTADQAHAVIPGVTLKLTNDDTGTTITAKSNHDGLFIFPSLVPGTYHLSGTANGFAEVAAKNILVDVSKSTRVELVFKPSTVNVDVVVTSQSSNALDLDNGYKGQLIGQKEIADLPLETLNPLALAALTPGVQAAAGNSAANRSGSDGSTASSGYQINGGIRSIFGGNSEYLVDGVSVSNPNGGTISALPSASSIQEFQVQSGALSAEFGFTTGGVVNYITRSGTKDFHGGAFEDVRNTVLNAHPAMPYSPVNPPLNYNQFGANLSGPVWIPKLYDGRKRTFFLFDYEGLRWDVRSNALGSVPTVLMRQGIFTEVSTPIYDPASNSNPALRTAFPNQTIPTPRQTAFGKQLLGLYPLPNRPGVSNNYAGVSKTNQSNDIFTIRGDQYIGEKHRLMFKYTHTNYASPVIAVTGVNDSSGQHVTIPTFAYTGSYNYTISPRLLYTAVAGYIWSLRTNLDPSGNTVGTSYFGYTTSPALASGSLINVRPAATVSLEGGLGTGVPQIRKSQTKELSQILSVTAGKHFLRVGVDLRNYICSGLVTSGSPTGSWGFSPLQTSLNGGSTSGNAVASLLLGLPNTISFDQEPYAATSYSTAAFFVADDWKITPSLTINMGMRYGFYTPIGEKNRLVGWLNTKAINPIVGIPGLYEYAGLNGNPGTFTSGDYQLFAPRLAFAYAPAFLHSTTVLRGGIGMYNGPLPLYSFYAASAGFNSIYNPIKPSATAVAAPLQSIYTLSAASGPEGDAAALGTSASGVLDRNMKSSRIVQWNLGVERQLPAKLKLEVQYSGNRGMHLIANEAQNLPAESLINAAIAAEAAAGGKVGTASAYLNTPVPNPLVGKVPGTLGAATVTREIASNRFPQFSTVTGYPGDRNSIYHSLQATLQRRAGKNLTLLASYTYSKTITDAILGSFASTSNTGSIQNPYDLRESRAVSDFDSTHVFTGTALYDLPFGKNQLLLNHGFLAALTGGFQLTTIVSLSTGVPLPISQSTTNGLGVGSARPDKIGNPAAGRTRLPSGAWQWINPAAYKIADGHFGNTPIRDTHLRAPAFTDIDLGLYRNFPIWERLALQFRAQAFNVPNHTRLRMPGTNVASASFGQITSSYDPRVIQLSLHLLF